MNYNKAVAQISTDLVELGVRKRERDTHSERKHFKASRQSVVRLGEASERWTSDSSGKYSRKELITWGVFRTSKARDRDISLRKLDLKARVKM